MRSPSSYAFPESAEQVIMSAEAEGGLGLEVDEGSYLFSFGF